MERHLAKRHGRNGIRRAGISTFAVSTYGDSPTGRLALQPDAENVASRVYIPVVGGSAVAAFPASYSKRAHTFRAAGGNSPAARARLGTVPLAGFDIHRLPPGSLVSQHMAERRPARVKHGLGKSCLGDGGGVHIANDDQRVLTGDPRGLLVKMVTTGVRDLRVDCPDPLLVSRALRDRQPDFVLSEVLERGHHFSIGERGEVFEAKVYTDHSLGCVQVICDLALKGHVPSAPCVLDKVPSAKPSLDLAALPEAIPALEVNRSVAVNLGGARNERHPTECALAAEAGAEPWAFALFVSAFSKLSADLGNCVGVDSKLCRHALRQTVQVECGWPTYALVSAPATLSFALSSTTEVPDLVTSKGVTGQMFSGRRVFDSELECDDRHAARVFGWPAIFKSTHSSDLLLSEEQPQ